MTLMPSHQGGNTVKRKPGRPKDTGIDDTPYLHRVAVEMISSGSSLSVAMAQVRPEYRGPLSSDESLFHRWRKKWKASNGRFLIEARAEQREATRRDTDAVAAMYGFSVNDHIRRTMELSSTFQVQRLIESSVMAHAVGLARERLALLDQLAPQLELAYGLAGQRHAILRALDPLGDFVGRYR